MKKNLFFLYLFILIFMHHDIIQSYDPQCTFTPDLGGLCNNQQNKQSKFQSAFAPSSSHLKNVSPQVNPTLSYKTSKEKKKVGLIAGLVHRIFGWGKSKKENTVVQQSPIYVSAQHVYYPSPLLINLTQEQPPQFLQQPSVTLPKTPEISTQVLRNLQKNNNIAYAANNRLNDQEFKNIMLKRGQALEKSVHPATTCLQSKRFNTQTAGFLQAHNIALQPFQVALTQLYNQSNASIVADALASGASQVVSNVTRSIIENNAHELSQLVPAIRQLQDLANFTRNFTNLADLIPQDILYLHRIYELQEYRAQIVNYLQEHKPYFIYEGQQYFIEDIASYHIHAGDYFRKKAPKGGHSNYGGNKLDYFNPELIASGPHGTKKMQLHNSRFSDEVKDSSIYPENWSEFTCDINAIEMMMHKNAFIKKNADLNVLDITGYTPEGFKIQSFYDIEKKRIRSHYPKFD